MLTADEWMRNWQTSLIESTAIRRVQRWRVGYADPAGVRAARFRTMVKLPPRESAVERRKDNAVQSPCAAESRGFIGPSLTAAIQMLRRLPARHFDPLWRNLRVLRISPPANGHSFGVVPNCR
jgi:hypothetical protein